MLGTKCPSITSRWIQSAPAASTARTSSPSLAKSAARIDGAMTRGRDANCWDMCAFPNLFPRAERPRVTWGRAGSNVLAEVSCGRKNLPQRAAIAGFAGTDARRKARFYWVFLHGTTLAEKHAHERTVGRHRRGHVGVPPCYLLWALRHR